MNAISLTIAMDNQMKTQLGTKIFTPNQFTIGRSFPFLIPIKNDPSVEEKSIMFQFIKDEWTLTDVSYAGSYIRIPKNSPTKVKYGSYVVIGLTWIYLASKTCAQVKNRKDQLIKECSCNRS